MSPLFPHRIAAALLAFSVSALAQIVPAPELKNPPPPPASASTDSAKQAYIATSQDSKVTVAADYTYTAEMALEIRVQSQAGVQQLGVLNFTYASQTCKAAFDYARVRKADATVVETPLTGVQDQPAAATQQAPMYSDLRVIQLPVKGLSPGDTIQYKITVHCTHVLVPNQFYDEYTFIQADTVERETFEFRAPAAMALQVVSTKVQPVITTEKDERVYRWTTHNEHKQPSKEVNLDLHGRAHPPDILITTFKSWQDLGDWYSALASQAAAVTPPIQAKADELTKGLNSDAEKIAAIYNYVALQFRYIGLDFGIGRYKPHTAEDVLDNQYGDCKDKHTLLSSLLRAAGYASSPVLISSDTAINPDVPSPSQFDHVITLITAIPNSPAATTGPDFSKDLLVDSTSGLTSIGVLLPALRDKQALIVRSGGHSEMIRTALAPAANVAEGWDFASKGKLDKDGTLHASVSLTWNADLAIYIRSGFRNTSRSDWTALMQKISYGMGFGGQVSNPDISDPSDMTVPMHAAYDYEREKYSDWEDGNISFPVTGFDLPSLAQGDTLKGDIYLGAPQVQHQHSEIDLPEGYSASMPSDVDIKTDGIHYQATYTVDHLHLETDRKLTIETARLPNTAWKSYSAFVDKVNKDTGSMIGITSNSTPANTSSDNTAHNEVLRGFDALKRNDLKAAKSAVKKAQALNPNEPGLWAIATDIARQEGNVEEMHVASVRMVENSPQDAPYVMSIAQLFLDKGKPEYAIDLLETQVRANLEDTASAAMLGGLVMDQPPAAARITGIRAIAQMLVDKNPDNGTAMLMSIYAKMLDGPAPLKPTLAEAFAQEPQPDLARHFVQWFSGDAAQLRSAVTAYVQALEKETATITFESAGKDDARHIDTLATAWEMLGSLEMKSADYLHARGYLQAAWALGEQPSAAVALGELDEAESKETAAAIHMYQLAASDTYSRPGPDAANHLHALHAKTNTSDVLEEFNHLRIVDVPDLKAKNSVNGDFWVLYKRGAQPIASYIKGANDLSHDAEAVAHALKSFPLPDDGPEVILRRGILGCYQGSGCQFVLMLPEDAVKNSGSD